MFNRNIIAIGVLVSSAAMGMGRPWPEIRVNKIINASLYDVNVGQDHIHSMFIGSGATAKPFRNNQFMISNKQPLSIYFGNNRVPYKIVLDLNKSEIRVVNENNPKEELDHLAFSNQVTAIDVYIDKENAIHLFYGGTQK